MLYHVIDILFSGYIMVLSIVIISSWFPELQDLEIIRLMRRITDPYLSLFRRYIPPLGPLDISPIAAFLVLQLLERCVKAMVLSHAF